MKTFILIFIFSVLLLSCDTKTNKANSVYSQEDSLNDLREAEQRVREAEQQDSLREVINEGAWQKIQNGEDMIQVTADYYNNYERRWYKMDLYIVPVYRMKGLSTIYIIGYGFGSNVVACKKEASPINEKELAIFARNAISPDYCPNYSVYISEEDIYAFFRFDGISTIYYSGKKRGDY